MAQAYALKYPTPVRRLVLASTFHSAEMWQEGNNGTLNFEIRINSQRCGRSQAIRRSGRLPGDAEYQAIQGDLPVSLL